MDALNREDLLNFLNTMLEAERAGAKALLHIARDTERSGVAALAREIHRDEAKWCAMLTTAIRTLGGNPSSKTGQFYEKVMAITEDSARLDLVNRGQGWVVRKLREVLPKIGDPELSGDLAEMLSSHEDNIARVAGSDLIR
jgi:nitronate monooxygenase